MCHNSFTSMLKWTRKNQVRLAPFWSLLMWNQIRSWFGIALNISKKLGMLKSFFCGCNCCAIIVLHLYWNELEKNQVRLVAFWSLLMWNQIRSRCRIALNISKKTWCVEIIFCGINCCTIIVSHLCWMNKKKSSLACGFLKFVDVKSD